MEKKKKIYIAGKITGDPNFKEKFMSIQKDFEAAGYAVLNPAELPNEMNPGDYMRICLSMIDSCDIAYFMPDYEDSKGAQIEVRYANYIGKQVIYNNSSRK
jgi:nucleoside 2-deoxyribosyltransferase